ncbi:hypothetical protein J2T19_004969 [Paenibacillus tundrae]|uniref:Uncharacterized protein n=1 Tax=Paenibacillus tundrae TaxID=528187 RepID=A0ABT9WJU4_9BACL|nr:hypothetical protein [Paenibacillus tundrae]
MTAPRLLNHELDLQSAYMVTIIFLNGKKGAVIYDVRIRHTHFNSEMIQFFLIVRVQKGRFSVPRRWDEDRNGVAERRLSYVSNGHFG